MQPTQIQDATARAAATAVKVEPKEIEVKPKEIQDAAAREATSVAAK